MPPVTNIRVRALHVLLSAHIIALLALPKSGMGLTLLRPEDVTGMALIAAVLVLALRGPMLLPAGPLVTVTLFYLGFFWITLLIRDGGAGHYQAIVLWAKELSYVAFGYLAWLVNGENPGALLRVGRLTVLPALGYGLFQGLTGARGIYGISPLGHEASPASSGMVFLAAAMIYWLSGISRTSSPRRLFLFVLALVLIVASGSKVAVIGAIVFFGVSQFLEALHSRSESMIRRLMYFGVAALMLMAVTILLARLDYVPRPLSRYSGFLTPWIVLMNRGIWWKLEWLDGPAKAIFGAGYSVAHLSNGAFSYSMAMDNQILYYLVTGGVVGLLAYTLLLSAVFTAQPMASTSGRTLRALALAYVGMGLGGEVLQLSVFGNVFWMVVGLSQGASVLDSARSTVRRTSPRSVSSTVA